MKIAELLAESKRVRETATGRCPYCDDDDELADCECLELMRAHDDLANFARNNLERMEKAIEVMRAALKRTRAEWCITPECECWNCRALESLDE